MNGLAAFGQTPGRCSVLRIASCIATTNSVWGEKPKYRPPVRPKAQAGVSPRQPTAIEERRSYAVQAKLLQQAGTYVWLVHDPLPTVAFRPANGCADQTLRAAPRGSER